MICRQKCILKMKIGLNDEEGIVKIVIPIDSSDNSNPKLKFKQKLFDSKYFLIYGLFIGFLIGILSTCNSKNTEIERDNLIHEDTLSQATDYLEPSYSLNDAITYLDNHEVWERSEMEKYDDLRGLFDDMNNFKYHSIITNYSQLEGSMTFRELEGYCKEKYHYESVSDGMGGNPTGNSSSNASRHKNKYSYDENISINKYMSNDKNYSTPQYSTSG